MSLELVAAIIIKDKEILLVNNIKHKGLRIEPPGGKREVLESRQEATKREVKEELGIEVEVGEKFGVYPTNSPEGDFQVFMFFCTIISGQPTILEPRKINAYRWYNYQELKELANQGTLVPNLQKSLPNLKGLLT